MQSGTTRKNTPSFTRPGPPPASWATQPVDDTQQANTHLNTTIRTRSPAPSSPPQERLTMGTQGRGLPLRAAAALPDSGIAPPWAPTANDACGEVSSSESDGAGVSPNGPGYMAWQRQHRRQSELRRNASR